MIGPRFDGATLALALRNPFDAVAEGLSLKNNRGDNTATELFVAGVWSREAELRRQLEDHTSSQG